PRGVDSLRWRTVKAQEPFLYLLQNRGQIIRKDVLVELLWPDNDAEKAYQQLYTAIYQVRNTLKPYHKHLKIRSVSEGYLLEINNTHLDVEEWESMVSSIHPTTIEKVEQLEETMTLYQ